MALPVTDSFTGAAASLSNPPYTAVRAGETLRLDGSGNCVGQASGVYAIALRNDETFTNAQSIEVTLASGIPAGGLVIYVNLQGTFGSEGAYDVYLDAGGTAGIERVVSGAATEVDSAAFTATSGDVFKFSHDGAGNVTLLKNGASTGLSYTDGSPLTGGAPGLGVYGDTGQTIKMNSATFDNVGAAAATIFPPFAVSRQVGFIAGINRSG